MDPGVRETEEVVQVFLADDLDQTQDG